MKSEFVRLNIAFIPDEASAKEAIRWSKILSEKYRTFFILDGKNYIPHVTIYSPEFPMENVVKVKKLLKEIATEHKAFEASYTKPGADYGFIDFGLQQRGVIRKLHAEIITRINPLREERVREKWQPGSSDYKEFTTAQKSMVQKFGFPQAMELYNPHLTITRLKDSSKVNDAEKVFSWATEKMVIKKIGIFKMGDHGTCVKLLESYPFRKKP